jgi:hypothetical protein
MGSISCFVIDARVTPTPALLGAKSAHRPQSLLSESVRVAAPSLHDPQN